MEDFRAYRIDQQDGEIIAGFTTLTTDDLSEGEVLIKVSHSTINYKDALAATGAGKFCGNSRWSGASTWPARS